MSFEVWKKVSIKRVGIFKVYVGLVNIIGLYVFSIVEYNCIINLRFRYKIR